MAINVNVIFCFALISWVIKTWAFVFFFVLAGLAIFHRRAVFKAIFFIFFYGCLLFYGFVGGIKWPFFSWHLYAININSRLEYFELRVADNKGMEIKYDPRAIAPIIITPLRRLSGKMAEMEPNERDELGRFLLLNAKDYRIEVEENKFDVFQLIKFPRHQYGFVWKKEDLVGFDEFRDILVYKITVEVEEDGSRVTNREESQIIHLHF